MGPTIGAAIGSLGSLVFQPRIVGVLVVTFVTMLVMLVLQVTNAPVLAVAILPLVFQTEGLEFPLSIFLATAGLFAFFLLWRRTLPPGVVRPPKAPEADGTPQWRVADFKLGAKWRTRRG
jgi:hypothetical protein